MAANMVTCGVLVTDGTRYLICHPTGGKWWDLPKGKQDPGETLLETAVRELREETDIAATDSQLEYLGTFDYRPEKRLALFRMKVDSMPATESLHCESKFQSKMRWLPEMDAFMIVDEDTCIEKVNPSMKKVLGKLLPKLNGDQL